MFTWGKNKTWLMLHMFLVVVHELELVVIYFFRIHSLVAPKHKKKERKSPVFWYLLFFYLLCLSLSSLLSSSNFWTLRCYSTMTTNNWILQEKWTLFDFGHLRPSVQQCKNCTKHLTCSLRLTQHWLVSVYSCWKRQGNGRLCSGSCCAY